MKDLELYIGLDCGDDGEYEVFFFVFYFFKNLCIRLDPNFYGDYEPILKLRLAIVTGFTSDGLKLGCDWTCYYYSKSTLLGDIDVNFFLFFLRN